MSPSRPIARREAGFTLIELLAVIAILGILAAIALNQFSVYRRNAVDTQMESDIHHARTAMEVYYERNFYTYVGATPDLLESDYGFRRTLDMDVELFDITATEYKVRACMPNGTVLSYKYETTSGTIVGENVPCS